MAINLNPPEMITAFESQLHKGKLVRISRPASTSGGDDGPLAGRSLILEFQYNPETITRVRTGQWEARPRRRRRRASSQQTRSRSAQGSAALLADSETISMRIVFDATEAIVSGWTESSFAAEREGVLAHLAALELIPQGKAADPRQRRRDAVRPVRPDELLLVLGTARYYPVVITSLTITEKKFNPQLVPIHAEVDLKMNVLEATESAYSEWIKRAFTQLVQQREQRAAEAYSEDNELLNAIERALNPSVGGEQDQ